jgi:AhpD family alkylhydroperoxidase
MFSRAVTFFTSHSSNQYQNQEDYMKLDDETKKLIAIGDCVAANCQPCLEAQVSQAKGMGIGTVEIEIAIKVGQSVRSGAASRMDEFIDSAAGIRMEHGDAAPKTKGCCC